MKKQYFLQRFFAVSIVLFLFIFYSFSTIAQENEQVTKYKLISGVVEKTLKNQNFFTIQIGDTEKTVESSILTINQDPMNFISIKDLREGDKATFLLEINSESDNIIAVIKNSSKKNLNLSSYDKTFTNKENTLSLIMGQNTIVINENGAKNTFSFEDIKYSTCLVSYNTQSKNSYSQTTPELVMILSDDTIDFIPIVENNIKYVSLRDAADYYGYSLAIEQNDKNLILKNNIAKIQLIIGNNTIQLNNKAINLQNNVITKNGKTYIPIQILNLLKNNSHWENGYNKICIHGKNKNSCKTCNNKL